MVDEEQLHLALAPLTRVDPPPASVIQDKARRLHRGHRNRVLGSAGASGAVLVLAAAGTLHIVGWQPGPNGEAPICTIGEVVTSGEAFGLTPGELPDSLRLGWTAPERAGSCLRQRTP